MILGLNLPVDSLERMNRKMSESVADFRASLPAPARKDEGAILVATADNKGVPMVALSYTENLVHALYPEYAKLAWDFAKHYSRDQKTGAINYNANVK